MPFRKGGDDIQRVREATDIVRLIGEHLALKPKGREFVGLCPFHDDRSPSMYVVPAKQIFHCFVCGASGDCYGFVRKFHKMEFREALTYLAEKASIKLTPWRKPSGEVEAAPSGPSRGDLVNACATANEFFRTLLRSAEHGAAGRAVIEKRGISPAMVEQFALGVSVPRWDGLLTLLRSKNLDTQPFLEAGLLKSREGGAGGDGYYDSFRNRLMFPIFDLTGRVVAFGGRKIDEADEPKYINSPETRLFNKSATLYGLHQAAKSIQHLKTAVITEGYTDTIACHQAGVTNVVATLGTALTRDHARILARYCERVVLMFDGDDAGQRAADRAVEIFFAEPLDVRIATLREHTDAKDPDELLKREGGAQVLKNVFEAATDLLEYRFARVRRKLEGTGPAALAKAINEEIARLRELGLDDVEPVKRRLIVRQLAGVAGVDERTILDSIGSQIGSRRVARAAPVVERDQTDSPDETGPGPQDSAAEHLLGCLLLRPLFAASLTEGDRELTSPAAYRSPLASSVAQAVISAASSGEGCALHAIVDSLNESGQSEAAEVAVGLAAKVQRLTDDNAERLQGHFDDCLRMARLNMGAMARRSTMDLASQIKLLQKQHSSLGGDSRVLPKGR